MFMFFHTYFPGQKYLWSCILLEECFDSYQKSWSLLLAFEAKLYLKTWDIHSKLHYENNIFNEINDWNDEEIKQTDFFGRFVSIAMKTLLFS